MIDTAIKETSRSKAVISILFSLMLLITVSSLLLLQNSLGKKIHRDEFIQHSASQFEMNAHVDAYVNSQFEWLERFITKEEASINSEDFVEHYVAQGAGINLDYPDTEYAKEYEKMGSNLSEIEITDEFYTITGELNRIFKASDPGYISDSQYHIIEHPYMELLFRLHKEAIQISDTHVQKMKVETSAQIQKERSQFDLILKLLYGSLLALLLASIVSIIRIERGRRERRKRALQLEEQLSLAKDDVTSLIDANERNTTYLSVANHELRTPLTSILGYVHLLKEIQTVDQQDEYDMFIEVVERKSLTLLDTINDLLIISQLENVGTEIDLELIELGLLCSEIISGFELEIKAKGLTVNLSREDQDSFRVFGVVKHLERAISNLVSNAIKYSKNNRAIEISLAQIPSGDGGSINELIVKDEGIGVPAEEIGKLFEKFYRASNSESQGAKGSGLGLAITRNIIESHSGTIFLKSVINQGTSVTVRIPAAETSTEKMIKASRVDVLKRAIEALESCELEELTALTHKLGGTIGFYSFDQESKILLGFSRWLKESGSEDSETIASKKEGALKAMLEKYEEITTESDM